MLEDDTSDTEDEEEEENTVWINNWQPKYGVSPACLQYM